MLPPVAIVAAAAPSPENVAAMDVSSASARLDRLLAARDLDDAGLRALAALDPELAWQLVEPRRRAALEFILSLPPADIRQIRNGQTVVVPPEAAEALFRALGVRPGRVRSLSVRTRDAQLVRVEMDVRGEALSVDLAWPPGMARGEAVAAMEAWLGTAIAAKASRLVDPGFEDPEALGVAWKIQSGAARLDAARQAAGRTSLRVEDGRVTQEIAVRPGDQVYVSAQVAIEGVAEAVVAVDYDGGSKLVHWAPGASGWTRYDVRANLPPNATTATVRLEVAGGAANFDDLRLIEGDPESFVASWPQAVSGNVVVRGEPGAIADVGKAAADIDRATRAGLSRIGVATSERVMVTLYGQTPPARRPTRGACWVSVNLAIACVIQELVTRTWGPPGTRFLAEGLPLALSGTGRSFPPPSLQSPPLVVLASGASVDEAVAASFAAWLLRTQGNAAVKAAWQATSLEGFTVAGMDLAAMDRAWRSE